MRPASGVPGECFSLKDRVDDAVDPTDEDDFVFEVTEEELEAEEEDGDGDYDGGELYKLMEDVLAGNMNRYTVISISNDRRPRCISGLYLNPV